MKNSYPCNSKHITLQQTRKPDLKNNIQLFNHTKREVFNKHNEVLNRIIQPASDNTNYTSVSKTSSRDYIFLPDFFSSRVLKTDILSASSDRNKRINELIIDLCLISRLMPTDIMKAFKTSYNHIKCLVSENCMKPTPAQDNSIRTVLDYLRNLKIDDNCTPSAKLSLITCINGLEYILNEHIRNNLNNFTYVNNLV